MKKLLPLAALLLSPHLYAVELNGTYIPQPGFEGLNCNPNEVGAADIVYQAGNSKRGTPRNCATVTNSNPVFFWTKPDDAALNGDMTITVKGANGYQRSITTKTPRLIWPDQLADGKYTWQENHVTTWGGKRGTQLRNFIVAASGKDPIPTGADMVTRAKNHAHPRILPEGTTFQQIRERIAADATLQASFDSTRRDADNYIAKVVTTTNDYSMSAEPAKQPSSQAYNTMLSRVASKERRAIETLGLVYFITGEQKYAVACAERLRNIASWSADENASTGETTQDQANRETYLALAMGLDIFLSDALQGTLSQLDIDNIVAKIKQRVGYVYPKKLDAYDYSPFDGHVSTASLYISETMMYVVGTPGYEEADAALTRTWSEVVMGAGAWGGTTDGAFGNSTSYGWYTMNIYARTMAMVKAITGLSLKDFRPMSGIGMNQIAQTPPGNQKMMGIFGDGTEYSMNFWDYARDNFRLLAHVTEVPEYEWYWRSYPKFVTSTQQLQPAHYLMLAYGPSKPPATTPTLPNAFLFEDAGYVAFHSDTTDPLRTSLFFRSSPLGSTNHSHGDNNSFNFFSKGLPVFISSGFYYSYDDPHRLQWTRHTKSKNALTFSGTDISNKPVSGIGQAESRTVLNSVIESNRVGGKLINYHADNEWMVATGDATDAYRRYYSQTEVTALLSKALRTVVYNKAEGIVLVYDYASSTTPRNWELNFHTAYVPKLQGNTGINIDEASVCTVLKGVPATLKNIDLAAEGIPMPPKAHEAYVFPQYHTRWTTDSTSTEFAALTVIKQNCGTSTMQDYVAGSKSAMKVSFGTKSVLFDKGYVKFE